MWCTFSAQPACLGVFRLSILCIYVHTYTMACTLARMYVSLAGSKNYSEGTERDNDSAVS